ncbi:ribonuclease 3-like protein 2 isoform X2 [Coffea eugenioides]|uniref:Ribonuclease 3-like protein 2 isoform X2 n=1 Tax=Coffea arabica TaxID=13443 RepID=A0A6P6XHP4_COFAR|nr:ribonuclease 3-like protein 2 isoform X2 [Coffea arabica]XP_027172772.1 ribonuclease 3-like protein 2 isoform X2 [Coffea eugenioides]
MKSSEKYAVTYAYTFQTSSDDDEDMTETVTDMAASVRAVEELLNYKFKNKMLLEEALTHSSYTDSASYQRLEFIGDAALGLAVSNYVFLAYPDLDPGQLSLLRAANISTEKLARVAVRHGLHKYVRHNAAALHDKVRDFATAVGQEDETEVHGGAIKAPKVLADIVESVAAAVYVDCGFDLQALWVKDGKHVDIRHWRKGEKNIASVYVDGQFVASACSDQKENAKLHAAKAALQKLSYKTSEKIGRDIIGEVNGSTKIESAKQKLHELCGRKRWPKPSYRIEKEIGPAHDRRFICSVQIEIAEAVLFVMGDEKSRVKNAENSAASLMLLGLQDS